MDKQTNIDIWSLINENGELELPEQFDYSEKCQAIWDFLTDEYDAEAALQLLVSVNGYNFEQLEGAYYHYTGSHLL